MKTPHGFVERAPGRRVGKSWMWFAERRSGYDRRTRFVGLCYTFIRPW